MQDPITIRKWFKNDANASPSLPKTPAMKNSKERRNINLKYQRHQGEHKNIRKRVQLTHIRPQADSSKKVLTVTRVQPKGFIRLFDDFVSSVQTKTFGEALGMYKVWERGGRLEETMEDGVERFEWRFADLKRAVSQTSEKRGIRGNMIVNHNFMMYCHWRLLSVHKIVLPHDLEEEWFEEGYVKSSGGGLLPIVTTVSTSKSGKAAYVPVVIISLHDALPLLMPSSEKRGQIRAAKRAGHVANKTHMSESSGIIYIPKEMPPLEKWKDLPGEEISRRVYEMVLKDMKLDRIKEKQATPHNCSLARLADNFGRAVGIIISDPDGLCLRRKRLGQQTKESKLKQEDQPKFEMPHQISSPSTLKPESVEQTFPGWEDEDFKTFGLKPDEMCLIPQIKQEQQQVDKKRICLQEPYTLGKKRKTIAKRTYLKRCRRLNIETSLPNRRGRKRKFCNEQDLLKLLPEEELESTHPVSDPAGGEKLEVCCLNIFRLVNGEITCMSQVFDGRLLTQHPNMIANWIELGISFLPPEAIFTDMKQLLYPNLSSVMQGDSCPTDSPLTGNEDFEL